MSMTNEQIQALKAAIDDATQGGWVNESGEGWEAICCDDDQGNAGFIIAEFQGRDAAANRKFVQCANPNTILSLLAERDADKALIAEQAKSIAKLERALDLARNSNSVLAIRSGLEARTLTVKLPKRATADKYVDGTFDNSDLAAIYNTCRLECEVKIKNACAAAGITLVVGE